MATSYRYFCLYHPTIRLQRLFWKKNHVKKICKKPGINKQRLKKKSLLKSIIF